MKTGAPVEHEFPAACIVTDDVGLSMWEKARTHVNGYHPQPVLVHNRDVRARSSYKIVVSICTPPIALSSQHTFYYDLIFE
jgi:hypothetical protein